MTRTVLACGSKWSHSTLYDWGDYDDDESTILGDAVIAEFHRLTRMHDTDWQPELSEVTVPITAGLTEAEAEAALGEAIETVIANIDRIIEKRNDIPT